MFVCEPCLGKRKDLEKLPHSFIPSHGNCELCKVSSDCRDVFIHG